MKPLIFKEIAHNSESYFDLVKLRDEVLRKPLNLTFTEEQLSNEAGQLHFGAYLNNTLLATFIFVKTNDTTLKMRQVAVAPKFQRMGYGKQLNEFAENWAIENGFKEIYCHARKEAVPFYNKCGYSVCSEEFFEVGIPHFKMNKKLDFI